ncbi:MAG: ABC transporter permease [Promethearchaeota archaeon]|nr:MAG: ABC transporter permease [Candidatus Lokiarchaeota archaeon]
MNIRRTTALLKMLLLKAFREPAYIFLMLLFPAVLTIMFGFIFGDPEFGMSMNATAPGLFAYACIFIIMTVAQSFTDMRDQGLLKRLNTTPMKPSDFMGGEIISNMILVILQVIIVYLLALPFGFTPDTNFFGILLAFLLMIVFSLSSVGLGLITASISKSSGTATGLSFIFILPQMFLGTFIPVTSTTEPFALLMPSYHAVQVLTAIFRGDLTSSAVFVGFFYTTIVSMGIIILGLYLFKKFGNK